MKIRIFTHAFTYRLHNYTYLCQICNDVVMYFSRRTNPRGSRANQAVCSGGDRPSEAQSSMSHAFQQVHPSLPPPLWKTVPCLWLWIHQVTRIVRINSVCNSGAFNTALPIQTAVTAYLKSKQLQLFNWQNARVILCCTFENISKYLIPILYCVFFALFYIKMSIFLSNNVLISKQDGFLGTASVCMLGSRPKVVFVIIFKCLRSNHSTCVVDHI